MRFFKTTKRVWLVLSMLVWLVCCGSVVVRAAEPPRTFLLDMVHDNLGESPRVSLFNAPKKLAEWGYTGQIPHLYVQCVVTFDSLEKGLVPDDSPIKWWIAQKLHFLKTADSR